MAEDDSFFSRWSRRKVQARRDEPLPEAPPRPADSPAPSTDEPRNGAHVAAQAPAVSVPPPAQPEPSGESAPLPTLDDVKLLTPDADFSRFVAPGVSPDVRNAAMKKLFADPFYNVMDGLDIYIDDYSKPDPLPASLARKLASAQFMKLFDEPKEDRATSSPPKAIDDGSAFAPEAPGLADPAPEPAPNPSAESQPASRADPHSPTP